MKHNITENKYYNGKNTEVTESEYIVGVERLKEIGKFSQALYKGEIAENEVPEEIKAEVTQAVEILNMPSLENEQEGEV